MKFLGGLLAVIIVLFIGGLLFSGLTEPKVTQTELTRDVAIPITKEKSAAPIVNATPAPTPAPAPTTTAPIITPPTPQSPPQSSTPSSTLAE